MPKKGRKTQRRRASSASEGAGGASLAAAGMMAPPAGLEELYAAVSAGNIPWGTMAELDMEQVKREGLGAALMALREPRATEAAAPLSKTQMKKIFDRLYAENAEAARQRRNAAFANWHAANPGRSRSEYNRLHRTSSSERARRRATLKKNIEEGRRR
jgi:hypothetical protein